MNRQGLLRWLASWERLGPLRSIEELQREMEQQAHEAGPAIAQELADTLVFLEQEQSPLLEPLLDFLSIYSALFPDALASALLRKLGSEGPPNLVEVLGSTRSPAAIGALREQLRLEQADEDLLVALASALGELGGPEAIEMLHELWQRPALPQRVRHEAQIAFERLGHPV